MVQWQDILGTKIADYNKQISELKKIALSESSDASLTDVANAQEKVKKILATLDEALKVVENWKAEQKGALPGSE